jgi:uncharacterized protein
MARPSAFIDTNLIIRLLTQDNPAMAQRAYALFKRIEAGELIVTTTEAVIVEVVHVLSSKTLYNLPRNDIKTKLGILLGFTGLQLAQKSTYLRALELFASTNLDFVDVLIVAHMEHSKINALYSFDHDFDRVHGIKRQEP